MDMDKEADCTIISGLRQQLRFSDEIHAAAAEANTSAISF
jgi:hypothetical protein